MIDWDVELGCGLQQACVRLLLHSHQHMVCMQCSIVLRQPALCVAGRACCTQLCDSLCLLLVFFVVCRQRAAGQPGHTDQGVKCDAQHRHNTCDILGKLESSQQRMEQPTNTQE